MISASQPIPNDSLMTCAGCQYSIAGLSWLDKCPECQCAVATSVRQWEQVRMLPQKCALAAYGIAGTLVVAIGTLVAMMLFIGRATMRPRDVWLILLVLLLLWCMNGAMIILTAKKLREFSLQPVESLRKATRVLSITQLCIGTIAGLLILLSVIQPTGVRVSKSFYDVASAATIVTVLVGCARFFTASALLNKFAMSTKERSLEHATRRVGIWMFSILGASAVGSCAIPLLFTLVLLLCWGYLAFVWYCFGRAAGALQK